jgi:hypothetical protein
MRKTTRTILITLIALMFTVGGYSAETPTPDEMVVAFFKTLESGAFEKGYQALFEGSDIIKEKPQAIPTLVAQTSAAFALYGKITGWEKVDETAYGQYLKRVRYLMNTKYPVAWELYFWKSKGQWSVYAVRFMDQVQNIFN